jgi:hypothetical protein
VSDSSKRVSPSAQLRPEFLEVVDFPIEREHIAPAFRLHRLMAARCQIDDRQPAMAKPDLGIATYPATFCVRSPMR